MRKFICNECGNPEPCVFFAQYDEAFQDDVILCPGLIAIANFQETDDAGEPK